LAADALLVEDARHDHGRRDAHGRAEEDAVHGGPAQRLADEEAEPEHESDLDRARHSGGGQHSAQAAQAELEADAEHDQDHAELGDRGHAPAVGDDRQQRDVRAHEQAREQVAEQHRLAQPAEDDRGDRRRAEHDDEVLEHRVRVPGMPHPADRLSIAAGRGASLNPGAGRARAASLWVCPSCPT
jgi:hypothetical protein